MRGLLALEDGRTFTGAGFGAQGVQTGELVFSTAMTGYQEILTDPASHRQIITLTVPHVGNTGINPEDLESEHVWAGGLVVRALSPVVSNWRSRQTLDEFLREAGVIGLADVATRALVRHIRAKGVLRAVIAHGEAAEDAGALVELARSAPRMSGTNLVEAVTCAAPYNWTEGADSEWHSGQNADPDSPLVVVYDAGVRRSALRMLAERGLRVTVVPATTPASEVLALHPAGVFLSNGPGDPAAADYLIENARRLLGRTPLFGAALGYQVLALALGGRTEPLASAQRGGNQPVKNLLTGAVEIAAHNHSFTVLPDGDLSGAEVTHISPNDNGIAGLRHEALGAFGVQYLPEASPDSLFLFDEFVERVKNQVRTME